MRRLLSRWFWSTSHDRLFRWLRLCSQGGSCDEFHVSCEDRINLYPAAPIRLATMLRAWTISCGWDGANLLDGIFCQADIEPHIRPANAPDPGR